MENYIDIFSRKPQYHKNKKGLPIKICCSSCRWSQISDAFCRSVNKGSERKCILSHKATLTYTFCEHWEMKEKLENICRASADNAGRIKTEAYRNYLLEGIAEINRERERDSEKGEDYYKKKMSMFLMNAHQNFEGQMYLTDDEVTELARIAVDNGRKAEVAL